MYPTPPLSYRAVKNKNPRKGTETNKNLLSVVNVREAVKNKNPRKGTETSSLMVLMRSSKNSLKTKIPVRGRKLLNGSWLISPSSFTVKNKNPRKGTETMTYQMSLPLSIFG